MRTPEQIETARLLLRRPHAADADAIFARYASVPDVTRYVGWPLHRSVDDTHAFLEFAQAEWDRWGTGAYLIVRREDGALLGGTGLSCETPHRAMTGYVLARDAWRRGYATESLHAMVDLAAHYGIKRLYALCHTEHAASSRVLEKCGFTREGTWRRHTEFPNLAPGEPLDVLCYARTF